MGGWRFRRSLRLLPGLRLTTTGRSLSLRLGPRGAGVTLGPSGARMSASVPGTGLYYTQPLAAGPSTSLAGPAARRRGGCLRWLLYGGIGLAVLFACGILFGSRTPPAADRAGEVVPVPTFTDTPAPAPTLTPAPTVPPTATATAQPTPAPLPVATATPCRLIKANAGSGIYHMPGDANYDRFLLDESAGDRWFCTEAEASAAGYRRARN